MKTISLHFLNIRETRASSNTMDNARNQDRFTVSRDEATGRLIVLREVACLVLIAEVQNAISVLMVSSRKKPSKWTLPKGGWELRETLSQAALREAYEEAGVGTHSIPEPSLRTVADGAPSGSVVLVNDAKASSFMSHPTLPVSLTDALKELGSTAVDEVIGGQCTFGTRFNWVLVDTRKADPESWRLMDTFPEVEERSRRWSSVLSVVQGQSDVKKPFADIVEAALAT